MSRIEKAIEIAAQKRHGRMNTRRQNSRSLHLKIRLDN